MAMLAEPRQRKRYNLTPRGKALYEDDTRFGTKMLEKMGWSKGKGLGAKENGSQDFVRVRMRNTNEGLGFEDRDDHWTQHEQDFNGLLKSLNGEEEEDNEKVSDNKDSASDEETPRVGFGFATESKKPKVEKLKDKISGISLEQKSKHSKARVHYKKFTKGKDIAQYSEKDLANIFGKKVVETEQADGVYAQLTAIMTREDKEKTETADAEENEVKPNFGGVQTISTGMSVSDYFKQKMEALKNKQKQNNNERKEAEIVEVPDEESTENKKKSKKRKHEREAVEAESQTTEANVLKEMEDSPTSEKDENKLQDSAIETVDLTDDVENEDEDVPKKKKKKKSKENQLEQHTNENEVMDEIKEEENSATEAPKKKKKSKKSKRKQSQDDDDVIIVAVEPSTYEKLLQIPEQAESHAKEVPTDGIKVKKNKKSKKEKKNEKSSENEDSVDAGQTTKKSKKSKKDVSEDNKALTLDELIAKYNSYNIYTISSFVAEKFRNVDLDSFKGSTITHIPGYTQTGDIQLKVVNEPKDEERITRLWNCSEDKYIEVNPKAIFGRYKQNTINAYRNKKDAKKPLPLFNIKSLKRKSVFQPI
ncbi:PIN2/TERF1-interacting telomerase inhibitor 1 [Zeugodacus cucurbitae]|uniref:PIN2/TERF1-interacting telomerase inhibitor 1 n=1 Tax=Zeugodacus cucurbitae TaxID=28588 RepID=UPI0023D9048B|nr:PIN2/TERF1-interacting telomerase inhibitor 1 [Zeugodacus cucurbitae]